MIKKYLSILAAISFFSFGINAAEVPTSNTDKKEPDPKNTLYIELKDGVVVAELFPNVAPMHVQRIRTLTGEGFYDGLKFHRVINGFMAQTGDPSGTGRGGSRLGKLYSEFNNEHHTRGTLSMARASDPNSANSQFFIVTGEFFPELDGQYTVFGRVINGMEYVDKIKAGDTAKNGMVDNPDVMVKVITGDMLNNKPLATVNEEIKVIADMQNEKVKSDPNYKKQSILGLLLEAKDIDINETQPEEVKPAVNTNANTVPATDPKATTNNTTSNTGVANGTDNKNGATTQVQKSAVTGTAAGTVNSATNTSINNENANTTSTNSVPTNVTPANNATNGANNVSTQNNNTMQNGTTGETNGINDLDLDGMGGIPQPFEGAAE